VDADLDVEAAAEVALLVPVAVTELFAGLVAVEFAAVPVAEATADDGLRVIEMLQFDAALSTSEP
jgi:hypothetical protein